MEIKNFYEQVQNLYEDFSGTLKTGARIDETYLQFFYEFRDIIGPIVTELLVNYPEWEVAYWRASRTLEFVGTLNRLIQEHKTNLYQSIDLKFPEPPILSYNEETGEFE